MQHLCFDDVAQLVQAVAAAGDPAGERLLADRRRALISELGRMVQTDVWIWVTGEWNPDVRGDAMITSFVDGGFQSEQERANFLRVIVHPELAPVVTAPIHDAMTRREKITVTRERLISETCWTERGLSQLWQETGFSDFILSVCPVGALGHSGVGFHRRVGRPRFTERDETLVRLVRLVFEHVPWLTDSSSRAATNAQAVSLSPRERQVVLLLMGGDSRKQVAHKLQLSQHTVTDYLKEIYRKFKVNSRSELLAKFISQNAEV